MSSQGAAASAASLPPFLAAIEALPRTRPPPANSSSQPQARRGQTALLQQPLTKREHLWQTFLLIDAESSEKHKAVMMGLPGNAWSCLDALATQSVERNRYTNVVPYNHNRVRLGFVDPSRRSGGAVGASKAGSTERRDGEESAGKSSSTRTQNVKGDASLSQPRSIGRNDASSYRNGQKDGSVCNDQENEFCDYFNASYITSHPLYTVSLPPSTTQATVSSVIPPPIAYIASQGPIPNTIRDHWRSIFEHRTTLIVSLACLEERGIPKCAQFWPSQVGDRERYHVPASAGQKEWTLEVALAEKRMDSGGETVIRKINLVGEGERERGETWRDEMTVWQLHFVGWPDHGVPRRPSSLLNLVRLANSPPFAPSPGPPLIHCSAGVGRTGTYIVVDVLIKAMREWGAQPGSTKPLVRAMGSTNLEEDPVAALVKHLRTQRVLMVQTPEQFGYIYECLVEAARGVGNA